jgi:hypothetical protein
MSQSIPTPLGGGDPNKPGPIVPKLGEKERCSRVSIQD